MCSSVGVCALLCPQWRSLSKEEQVVYFTDAEQQRLFHKMRHPKWSCKENYVSRQHNNVILLFCCLDHSVITCHVFVFRVKSRRSGRGNAPPLLIVDTSPRNVSPRRPEDVHQSFRPLTHFHGPCNHQTSNIITCNRHTCRSPPWKTFLFKSQPQTSHPSHIPPRARSS